MAPAMSRLAFQIAGRTLFGQDVSDAADSVGNAFAEVSKYLGYRFTYPLTSFPTSWPTRRNRQFRFAKRELFDIVLSLIRQHRSQARYESGGGAGGAA